MFVIFPSNQLFQNAYCQISYSFPLVITSSRLTGKKKKGLNSFWYLPLNGGVYFPNTNSGLGQWDNSKWITNKDFENVYHCACLSCCFWNILLPCKWVYASLLNDTRYVPHGPVILDNTQSIPRSRAAQMSGSWAHMFVNPIERSIRTIS